jgi:CrcB protein
MGGAAAGPRAHFGGGAVTVALALAIAVAGALAATARYALSLLLAGRAGWAVLVVNVVGSAIGGGVLALAERAELSADARLILLTGLCGGLTTFSTFGVETMQLALAGRVRAAALNVGANLALGVGAAAGAFLLLR